jgi:UDP-N-acetyl-D-galactosamine dehydrogenase
MIDPTSGSPKIVVIGLGYVGLPLAVALARKFDVGGFEVDAERIAELRTIKTMLRGWGAR